MKTAALAPLGEDTYMFLRDRGVRRLTLTTIGIQIFRSLDTFL